MDAGEVRMNEWRRTVASGGTDASGRTDRDRPGRTDNDGRTKTDGKGRMRE